MLIGPITGTLTSITKPMVNGETPIIEYTYNDRGQVTSTTDETGIVFQAIYSDTNETVSSFIVDYSTSNGHLNLTKTYGYNAWGDITSIQDPNLNTTQFTYDYERRETQKTDPSPFGYVLELGYDQNNALTSIKRQTGGVPAWQTYTIAYTLEGIPYTLTDPSGNVRTWNYDAKHRLIRVIDEQSRAYQFAYDARDNLVKVTDPTNTISQLRSYTDNGLLQSLTDAKNNLTAYSYDGLDRLNVTTYADTSFEQNVSYDANNNVLSRTTRSGNTITNTYDALNRLSTKTPTGEAVATFMYDLHGRKVSSSTPVVTGDPASGTFSRFYDTAGRFYEETAPDGKSTTLTLDNNGNVTQILYPDGYYVTRVYDQLNRLTDVKLNGASSSAAHINYDELSRRQNLTFGNGVSVGYSFQQNDDLAQVAMNFSGSSLTFGYGFSSTHQEETDNVTDKTYLWHPSAATTTTYSTANTVNQYPSVGGSTYSYDGNGNLSSDGTWTYTFDTENHLTAANKTGVSASFVYDPDHRRIQKTVGSTETRYVYSKWQRIADYDGSSGDLLNRYVYGDGLDEAIITVSASGTVSYMHADRHGSIVAVSNSSGAVANENQYSPFGENAPTGTTFGFTGQCYDPETGLYYFKRRYYNPSIGRFLQPDPAGFDRSLNPYTYVANDPLNRRDEFGLTSAALGQSGISLDLGLDPFDINVTVTAGSNMATLASMVGGNMAGPPPQPTIFTTAGCTCYTPDPCTPPEPSDPDSGEDCPPPDPAPTKTNCPCPTVSHEVCPISCAKDADCTDNSN